MPLLQDLKLSLEVDDVLRAQGGDPTQIRARRPFFVEVAERALAVGVPLLQPVALYHQFAVSGLSHERLRLEGGKALSGPLIQRHLSTASQVVVVLCTVGSKLEEAACSSMSTDPVFALALDGVGSAATEALATAVCRNLEDQATRVDLKATSALNPGMIGWPVLEGQQQLFRLINPREIGVELMPSGMMIPRKSLSLVVGLGSQISHRGDPCDHCTLRSGCRYRKRGDSLS